MKKNLQSGVCPLKKSFTVTFGLSVMLLLFTLPAFASEKLIIIGHKGPDTDAVISAIAYANLKKLMGVKEASPAVAGPLNRETSFVLDHFKVPYPEMITDCKHQCKRVILVDHNEIAQTVDNLSMENVVEVLDHHRIGCFNSRIAIFYLNEPVGATASIIAKLYEQNKFPVSREMAGLMLSAILSDTVLLKSPTSTPRDADMVVKLARIAGIDDPKIFGIELLKAKSNISSRSAWDLVTGDLKKYNFSGTKAAVGQIEVMDLNDLASKRATILEEMNNLMRKEELDMVVIMQTDVIKESSDLLFVGSAAAAVGFEKAFAGKIVDNSISRDKVLSRKLQVIPQLDSAFKK